MNTKRRYLTTLLVATAATGAAIGFAPVAIADPGAASEPPASAQVGPNNTPPDPGYWDGGQVAGGTGSYSGPDTAGGPSIWRGGSPAGGTGSYSGPDTGTGPNVWSGGQSAGAV